jgi:hypothetical protein
MRKVKEPNQPQTAKGQIFNYAKKDMAWQSQRRTNQNCQTPRKIVNAPLALKGKGWSYQISASRRLFANCLGVVLMHTSRSLHLPENEISASRQLNGSRGVRLQIKGRNCFDIETLWTRLRSIN